MIRVRLRNVVWGLVGMGWVLGAWAAAPATTQGPKPMTAAQIDVLVNQAMQAFHVPGISVGIVTDGKLIFGEFTFRTLVLPLWRAHRGVERSG